MNDQEIKAIKDKIAELETVVANLQTGVNAALTALQTQIVALQQADPDAQNTADILAGLSDVETKMVAILPPGTAAPVSVPPPAASDSAS